MQVEDEKTKTKIKIKRIVFAILIIINCIVIFNFSNKVADDSSEQSGRIVNFISQIIPSIKNMPEPNKTNFMEGTLTTIVRKTAHFSIYTLLGLLSMNFMITFKEKEFYKIDLRCLTTLTFCIFYAISDEFHQYFIPGRSCELRDVCIDTLGAILGILVTKTVTKTVAKIYRNTRKAKNITT